ncbi:MAG: hypothetical protein LBG60_04330, partial [Bifidobacteriaceae bacterium]|nr:hypothetical protein [Bifidobacteriaceae bacterium]
PEGAGAPVLVGRSRQFGGTGGPGFAGASALVGRRRKISGAVKPLERTVPQNLRNRDRARRGGGAHLAVMPTPHAAAVLVAPAGREPATLGARLAGESRARQGLAAALQDEAAAESLRAMCSLPRPRRAGSRLPHELDPAG